MRDPFIPTGLNSLAEIDTADKTYGNQTFTIRGVVSPSSGGGWFGENGDYDVHCISFGAWRHLGQPIVRRKLTVLCSVPKGAIGDWNDFPKLSIQQLDVFLSADETRAVLVKPQEVNETDTELDFISEELAKPVVIATQQFGKLVLDRTIDWFDGNTIWNDNSIGIRFPAKDERVDEEALRTAEQIFADSAGWKNRIDACAIKELLATKNDFWLEDGESPVTAEQFLERMTLTEISIRNDGEVEFWFDDGDLFWGHAIVVDGDLKNGPTHAGIHG